MQMQGTHRVQWQMQDLIRGGPFAFCARNFEAMPTIRLKPCPFSSVLERNFLLSLSIDRFLTETVLWHVKVSHTSCFLSSSALKGGFHLAYHRYFLSSRSNPKGGSMEP